MIKDVLQQAVCKNCGTTLLYKDGCYQCPACGSIYLRDEIPDKLSIEIDQTIRYRDEAKIAENERKWKVEDAYAKLSVWQRLWLNFSVIIEDMFALHPILLVLCVLLLIVLIAAVIYLSLNGWDVHAFQHSNSEILRGVQIQS